MALSLFTRFSPGCSSGFRGAEGVTLPPADSFVVPQVLSLTLELYLSALVKFAILRSIEDESVVDFFCLQVLMSLRLLGYCK